MFNYNNWDLNLYMGSSCLPRPHPLLEKVKLFIYGAIVLKFEIQQFPMCTNNNWEYNLDMVVSIDLPPPPSPLLPLKNVKVFIYSVILLKLGTKQFICIPIII